MTRETGIWIDHRKAVIVTLTGGEPEMKQIQSNIEKHVRFSSGSSEDGSSEDIRDRQYTNRLNRFYDAVIEAIQNVESILVIGPGEAKGELVKRLEQEKFGGRIAGLETVDKMTDLQIAEKIRQYFNAQKHASRT